MVAAPSARRLPALTAGLICLILLAPAFPIATAQVNAYGSITVKQGDVQFVQGGKRVWFLDNGTASVTVMVNNSGASQIDNVPVWFLVKSKENPGEVVRARCEKVNVPAATTDASGRRDGNTTAMWAALDATSLPAGPYYVDVVVNSRRPDDAPASAVTCASGPLSPPGAGLAPNTFARGYFVKGVFPDYVVEGIRWCPGANDEAGCDETMEEGTYNLSRSRGSRADTFFEAVIANNGTWTDNVDYGGPNLNATGLNPPVDYIPWELDFRINGRFIPTNLNITGERTQGITTVRSAHFNLAEKAGHYNVTARVDPNGRLKQTSSANDVTTKQIEVKWYDLTANFTASDFRTDPANPYPYPDREAFTIRGNVTFRNDGPGDVRYSPANWRIFLDDGRWLNRTGSNGTNTIMGYSSWTHEFAFDVTTVPGAYDYIAPGRHTIYAQYDSSEVAYEERRANRTFEIDETNNNITIDIYLADTTAPTFPNAPKITNESSTFGSPDDADVHPHEKFRVYANITDTDAAPLNVVATFTLDSDPTVQRTYPLSRVVVGASGSPSVYGMRIDNFTLATNASQENWTLQVRAADSFDNNATSGSTQLRLTPWGIHNASVDYVVIEMANGTNLSWGGTDPAAYRILVHENATGFKDQYNTTENLAINLTTPLGVTYNYNGSFWSKETRCQADPSPLAPALKDNQQQCLLFLNKEQFRILLDKYVDGAAPGQWNASIRIKDIAGFERVINRTFNLVDSPPTINVTSLSPAQTEPGESFTIKANFTDDFRVEAAHANFTRVSDGVSVNLTLTNPKVEPVNGTSNVAYAYNNTFKTGRNEVFGIGGTFNVTIAAVDQNGNWNATTLGNFTLNDTRIPNVIAVGAAPAAQEANENVTFYARASDETNLKAYVQVLRGSEEVFPKARMTEGPDGNLTYTASFPLEGSYLWNIEVVDSVGRSSGPRTGPLTIADNLGPKFEVRSPSTVVNFARYGSATPRIELLAYDSDGVVPTSVDMKVAGIPVVPDIIPAPTGFNGFIISYTVPAAKKFSHRDVVNVSVAATDNSTGRLPASIEFSFAVDDLPPVARVVGISPSHRDQPAHPLNVSLNTRFTLAAEDNDGLPTDVESIRYKILGGGNNAAETVYTGPFRITDAPGVYTGPRVYQIQFWAEDSVGNYNRQFNLTTIFVDDTPPALFQFFPQGRYINATFVDDRVGVDRAVAWHRVNAETYKATPLVETDGVWSLVLPEGRKGDTISYYLQAWDRLNNTDTFGNATAPYASFDVSNHEPRVKITSPVEGSRVSRNVDLTWTASDEDGDAMVFTIYYRAPGKSNFVEIARLENTEARSRTIDTTRFADGEYTFRVAAGDGGFVKISETTVTIINRAEPIGVVTPPPGEVLPGDRVLLKAEITKAQATVEARLYRDGKLVDAFAMNDEGREGDELANDGIYSVSVSIAAAGDYSVEIYTTYQEDGVLQERTMSDAAVFSAKLTPRYILSEYGTLLVIIGLLAIAGVGVAAFVLIRRR